MQRFPAPTQLVRSLLLLLFLALTQGCGDHDEISRDAAVPSPGAKDITSFVLSGADNRSLGRDVGGTISAGAITLSVPNGTDLTALRPTIVHNGAVVVPASGEPRDFTTPVNYTVTAQDGSTATYTVTITIGAATTNEEITTLKVEGFDTEALIEGTSIALTLPFGSDVSALRLALSFTGVSVSPASGSVQDLRQPAQYTVTAPDGSATTYTVAVNVAPSNAKEIAQFKIGGTSAVISGSDIALTVPFGTDLRAVTPAVSHTGASIAPAPGVAADLRAPVEYTVTAADGSTKRYTARIAVAPSTAKDLTQGTILGQRAVISGNSVTVTVPHGTDVTQLVPTIVHTGAALSAASGVTLDFSAPVAYQVTAADGSTQRYTFAVNLAPSSAKAISGFSILGTPAEISGNAVALTLPFGTDLRSLAPRIRHTGASVTPASGSLRDFSAPVTYTVVAADGSTHTYTVIASVAPSTAKEIVGFSVLGRAGTISGSSISLTVPHGASLESLEPIVTHTGVSVSPPSGTPHDFRAPVAYTVTAGDGSTRTYSVSMSVAANTSKEITAFAIQGITGAINGTNITLMLPYGTDRSSLQPTLVHTGANISPVSGQARDFRMPTSYTVTAADGSTRTYTVTVTTALNSAKEITEFSIFDIPGDVGANTVNVMVPFGSDLTALAPHIEINGTSISPPNGTPQDFTSPVAYTVAAENGTKKTYTVTVTAALEAAKDITSFAIFGIPATIGPNTIEVTVPHGTDPSSLTPTFKSTGVSIRAASGVAQDFSAPVVYTVTAQNGTEKTYTVTVNVARDGAKDITSFAVLGIPAAVGPNTIDLTVPYGTDPRSLTPTFTSTGVSVSPASGVAQDFSTPMVYTVTAQDGTSKTYTVTIGVALSSAKDIQTFSILGIPAAIGPNTIDLTVPHGTDPSSLKAAISSTGVSVSPPSGTPRDFSSPVLYTVTAQDGTTKTYTANVGVALNNTKDITAFTILGVPGNIGPNTIALTVPYGTDRTSLTPTVASTGVSVSPSSGAAQDFSGPVIYTVNAQDGSTKTYTVSVDVAQNSTKDITAFSILGVPANIGPNTITLAVPHGTSRSNLTPTLSTTGASVSPASGVAQDFSSPLLYTVTAPDGTTKTYTVTVDVAQNSAKDITAFSILGVPANIGPTTIRLTVPYGTDRSSLTPTVNTNGMSVSPNSGAARDFSSPVTYTVTALDGSTKTYLVTVDVALSSAKNIDSFSISGIPGDIGPNTITLTVPYGTNPSSLTPAMMITGSGVSPTSGVAQNFSSPVLYTVTAQDGSTKTYTVTVNVAPNSAKEITAFSISGVAGVIGTSTINVTMPHGTNRSSLAPMITSNGAMLSPGNGVMQDFTGPVVYTVTAQNGTTKTYTVTVDVALNTAKDITSFSILGHAGAIGTNTVTLRVPWGTDLTSLAPVIGISGTTVSPASGVVRSFASPVSYIVRADDGTTKTYTVTVTASPSLDCAAEKRDFPASADGVYTIDPDGVGVMAAFSVYCDMTNDGGGWTLIGKTAAGDYSSLTDAAYLNLIANPTSDVNVALLQSGAVPSPGQIAFYDRAKTNALYHTTSGPRAVRVNMSNNLSTPGANSKFFQQRVGAPINWNFWAALRNSLLWNRDGTGVGDDDDEDGVGDQVAYFGVDVLLGSVGDFNAVTNVVSHTGDGTFWNFSTYVHTLNDGSTLRVSRHMGLLNDGWGNLGMFWILTSDRLDTRWKQDLASLQRSLIWLR